MTTTRIASADAAPEPYILDVQHLRTAAVDLSDGVGSGEASAHELRLGGTFARTRTALGTLLFGARYERRRFLLPGRFADETLHELKPSLTLVRERRSWRLLARIAPGVATDFERVTDDDASVDALAQLVLPRGADTRWVLGLAVDRTFADTDVYPVAGLVHAPNGRLWLGLVFPRPAIRFAVARDALLYWRAEPVGNRWNVERDGGRSFDLTLEALRTGVGVEWRAERRLRLRLELGRELGRRLETLDGNGVRRELEPADTSYVGLSLELLP